MAQAILMDDDCRRAVLEIGRAYPGSGYGGPFARRLVSPHES